MALAPVLAAWLYDTHVADLRREGDRVALTWTPQAAQRWGLGSRVVSDLLPIDRPADPPHVARVTAFLSGLLAEGNLRAHLAFEAGVTSDDVFGLLATYGRDTAGALVFLSPTAGPPARWGDWVPVDDVEVAQLLRAAGRWAPDARQLTSLAGVQPKIVLRRHEHGWFRCDGGAPSTHILKLGQRQDSPMADVVDTEAACLDLARRLGLTTVDAEVVRFDDVRALAVSRYDRRVDSDGGVQRLHQEDASQALGLDTFDQDRKSRAARRCPRSGRSLSSCAAADRNPTRSCG